MTTHQEKTDPTNQAGSPEKTDHHGLHSPEHPRSPTPEHPRLNTPEQPRLHSPEHHAKDLHHRHKERAAHSPKKGREGHGGGPKEGHKEEDGGTSVEETCIEPTYIQEMPKPRKGDTYTPKSQAKQRRVIYHPINDLADAAVDEKETITIPKADDLYSPWDDSVKPMKFANVVSGLSMAVALVAEVAVKGTKNLTHDRCWLPVQFLKTVMDDRGEIPPNILNFLEYIDMKTKKPDKKCAKK